MASFSAIIHWNAQCMCDSFATDTARHRNRNTSPVSKAFIQNVCNRKNCVFIFHNRFYNAGCSHGNTVESSAFSADNLCAADFCIFSKLCFVKFYADLSCLLPRAAPTVAELKIGTWLSPCSPKTYALMSLYLHSVSELRNSGNVQCQEKYRFQ